MTSSTLTKVAAIQMCARLADVEYNLQHIHKLVDEAIQQGATVIALPEFFTTSIVLDDRIWDCALPPENKALDMLIEIAISHKVLIGGSYLERRNSDIYNCYTLVQPDGTVTRHDKDLPTMIENAFYVGGKTRGVHQTRVGRVGTAMCWETIRTQTVNRLKGQIDFLMTGSHWWTVPCNYSLGKSFLKTTDKMNREIMHTAPGQLSRLLGVANIHAAHCSNIKGRIPVLPLNLMDIPFESSLIGETQIVDNRGNIIERLSQQDGPGVIVADLDLSPNTPSEATPNRFWIPRLPLRFKINWWHQNFLAKRNL